MEENNNIPEESQEKKCKVEEAFGGYIRSIIETLLFINEKPITIEQIRKVLKTVSASDLKKVIRELSDEYEDSRRGMLIKEIAGGYQMLSNPSNASYVRSFYKVKHKEKLSKPALETIAIIAYKQPVTRGDIELVRSVNSDGVVAHLLNKELVKVVGRKDAPGRPFLYGTTKQFLEYFGLRSLDDLPALEEFPALQDKIEQEDQARELSESTAPAAEDQDATSTTEKQSTDENSEDNHQQQSQDSSDEISTPVDTEPANDTQEDVKTELAQEKEEDASEGNEMVLSQNTESNSESANVSDPASQQEIPITASVSAEIDDNQEKLIDEELK